MFIEDSEVKFCNSFDLKVFLLKMLFNKYILNFAQEH